MKNWSLSPTAWPMICALRCVISRVSPEFCWKSSALTLDAEAARYLKRIQDGTHKMGQLVDELLTLARVGRQAANLQATGLNSLVHGSSWHPSARDRGPKPGMEN